MAWGCTEESLDYRKQEGYVQIALSWDEGFSPAGSRFYFYPENGGEMLSFDCPSEGFGGVLPVGRYRVIVVNSDCVNVAVRNERSYDTAEIYVLPDEDGEHVCQPERLAYATRLVESETLEVPYRDTVRVAAAPCSCIKHVRFMLEIGDFVPLSFCRGSFSGVSLSRHCLFGTLFLRRRERAFYRRSRCGELLFHRRYLRARSGSASYGCSVASVIVGVGGRRRK